MATNIRKQQIVCTASPDRIILHGEFAGEAPPLRHFLAKLFRGERIGLHAAQGHAVKSSKSR